MLLHDVQSDIRGDAVGRGRYYGFVVGKVTNVSDDQGLGRIKARYAAQGDNEESDWLIPMWPGSLECIPRKDDMVVIGFIDGDPHKGFYAWHPTSNTQNRPTEAAVLGTTAWGMINYLVDQFNQLRSDFNSHVHTIPGTGTTCVNGSAWTGTATSNAPTATSANTANKGQAADGSTVGNVSSASKVLSGNVKVGK